GAVQMAATRHGRSSRHGHRLHAMATSLLRGLAFDHGGVASRDRGLRPAHSLTDLEAFELRMLEVKWAGGVIAGARVCGTKRLRSGPGLERRLALPDRVRGIERVVLGLGALEQMEFDETGNLVQMRVAAEPDPLKGLLRPALHTKAIHRDEHTLLLSLQPGRSEGAVRTGLSRVIPHSA